MVLGVCTGRVLRRVVIEKGRVLYILKTKKNCPEISVLGNSKLKFKERRKLKKSCERWR